MAVTRETGTLLSVESTPLGSTLDGDHAASATLLTVLPYADDFDPGMTVDVDGTRYEVTAVDYDAAADRDLLTITPGLTALAEDGTRVDVWDPYRDRPSMIHTAAVALDGPPGDPIEAVVSEHLVDALPTLLRDSSEGERVAMDVENYVWRVVDVAGRDTTGTRDGTMLADATIPAAAANFWASDIDGDNAISTAQSTADGKNRVIYSASDPSTDGLEAEGDIWFKFSGSLLVGHWRWDGTAWDQQTIDNAVIANLDAAKITTGILDAARIGADAITASKIAANSVATEHLQADSVGADQITAEAISVKHLRVGLGANVIENPGYEAGSQAPHVDSAGKWVGAGITSRSGQYAGRYNIGTVSGIDNVVFFNGSPNDPASHVKTAVGDTWVGTAWVRDAGGSGEVRLRIMERDANGDSIGSLTHGDWLTVTNTYQQITVKHTVTQGDVDYVFLALQARDTSNLDVLVDDVDLRQAIGGDLIVDGAIDGKTITGALIRTDDSGNRILIGSTGTSGVIQYETGSGNETVPGFVEVVLLNSGAADEYASLQMESPDFGNGRARMFVDSARANGSVNSRAGFQANRFNLFRQDGQNYLRVQATGTSSRTGILQGGVNTSENAFELSLAFQGSGANEIRAMDGTQSSYVDLAAADFVVSSSGKGKTLLDDPEPGAASKVRATPIRRWRYAEPLKGEDDEGNEVRSEREQPERIGPLTEEADPSLVRTTPDGEERISQTAAVWTLWQAVQEQQAQIEALQARLTELER